MHDKKTVLIAQIIITFLMSLSMSGLMSLIAMGPTPEWFAGWPKQFIIAWPIAFVFTQVATRIGFGVAHKITAPKRG